MTDEFPPSFWVAIAQFNQRQFYACHDTLEEIWMEAIDPEKTFYQGILQIAVGLYHLGNRNWQGAVTLLGAGTQRLSAFQPDYGDVDVVTLMHDAVSLLKAIQTAGPDRVGAIAHQLEQPDPQDSEALSFPIITRISEKQS
jgi:hypothetical protein